MASEGLLKSGFVPALMNENNMCQLAMPCQTTNKSLVEFHKGQYLDHFFFYSILMISITLLTSLISIYLLMTLIFFMPTRVDYNWKQL